MAAFFLKLVKIKCSSRIEFRDHYTIATIAKKKLCTRMDYFLFLLRSTKNFVANATAAIPSPVHPTHSNIRSCISVMYLVLPYSEIF